MRNSIRIRGLEIELVHGDEIEHLLTACLGRPVKTERLSYVTLHDDGWYVIPFNPRIKNANKYLGAPQGPFHTRQEAIAWEQENL